MPDAGETALTCLHLQAMFVGMQMVFSSSCTVYGNPSKVPIDETHPLNACSPYGRTKLIIEDMFRDLAASPEGKEWSIILLRYFNPVGAHPSGILTSITWSDMPCALAASMTAGMELGRKPRQLTFIVQGHHVSAKFFVACSQSYALFATALCWFYTKCTMCNASPSKLALHTGLHDTQSKDCL